MLVRLFARLTTARSVLDFFCRPVRISSYSSRAELGSDHVRRDWAEARPPANVGVGSRGCRDLRGVGGRDGGGPRFPYDTSTGARHFTGPGLAIQLFACPVSCAYFGHVRQNPTLNMTRSSGRRSHGDRTGINGQVPAWSLGDCHRHASTKRYLQRRRAAGAAGGHDALPASRHVVCLGFEGRRKVCPWRVLMYPPGARDVFPTSTHSH